MLATTELLWLTQEIMLATPLPSPGLRTVPSGVFHAVLGGRWVGVLSDASVCPLALGPLSHM